MSIDHLIAKHLKANPDYAEPLKAWGFCVHSTYDFIHLVHQSSSVRLHMIRATGQSYPGREHWAAIWFDSEAPEESTVYDFTLRQFLGDAPLPFTGPLTDWYDLMCDGINDYLNISVFENHASAPFADWTDEYARDDFEPGPNRYPWEKVSA